MNSGIYKDSCKGCEISQRKGKRLKQWGGVITLDGGWLLNHGKGTEVFLGWVALQPKKHRESWAALSQKEAMTLGRNIRKIENGLREYWDKNFKKDPIERLYVVCFYESSSHLHIHIIPRPKSFERLIVCTDARSQNSEIENSTEEAWAWKTYLTSKCPAFPAAYKIHPETQGRQKAKKLMAHLRSYLKKVSAK